MIYPSAMKHLESLAKYFDKIKKSGKAGQNRKILMPDSSNFLSFIAKNLFLQGKLDTRLCSHSVLGLS